MKCPRCKIEMTVGMALPEGSPKHAIVCFGERRLKGDVSKYLFACYKCSQCGHSDDGVDEKGKCVGVFNHNA